MDAPVIPGTSRRNRNLSCIQIDIFIARDVFHLHLSRGHLHPQAGLSRYLNADLKIALMEPTAGDGHLPIILVAGESDPDLARVLTIAGGAGQMKRFLVGSDNFQTSGGGMIASTALVR